MNRLICAVLALSFFLWSPFSDAAVFERDWRTPGDGLLTFDDVNQREWLDLTETQLFRFPGGTLGEQYQAVLAEGAPGARFTGFLPATREEVFALASSAGINTTTTNFEINRVASQSLIALLGDPIVGAASPNKWAAGFLGDGILSTSLAIAYVPAARDVPSAGITLSNFLGSGNGVWLYRPIPEANTTLLALSALATLLFCRGKRR